MKRLSMITLCLAFFATAPGHAAVSAGDLPGETLWYLHVDLKALREAESGSEIMRFLEAEVFVEVRDEVGIDLNEEVNRFTAFSDAENGTVIIVEGPMSKITQDKLLGMAGLQGDFEIRRHGNASYYHVGDEGDAGIQNDDPFDDLEDSAYFSFGIDGKAILTSSEARMKALLDAGGRIAGAGSHSGALFVLTADKSFVQAGLKAGAISHNGEDGWESNILRNTREAALLIADSNGRIAVEAQLVSVDPSMTQAIGGIVNGLISLQAFNSELPPEARDVIQNTRVDVTDSRLSISTVIDPAMFGTLLD